MEEDPPRDRRIKAGWMTRAGCLLANSMAAARRCTSTPTVASRMSRGAS